MQAAGGFGVHTMDRAEGREGNVNMKHALVHWCTGAHALVHQLTCCPNCRAAYSWSRQHVCVG